MKGVRGANEEVTLKSCGVKCQLGKIIFCTGDPSVIWDHLLEFVTSCEQKIRLDLKMEVKPNDQ